MSIASRVQNVFDQGVPEPVQNPVVLTRFEELCAALAVQGVSCADLDDDAFRRLALLAWQSPYLTQLCLADPGGLVYLMQEGNLEKARRLREYRDLLNPVLTEPTDTFGTSLRIIHGRELLRIAWRHICDLAGINRLMEELSDLADCTVEIVTEYARQNAVTQFGTPESEDHQKPALAVLAMGKLGGRGLNFSSDVDLLFVYRGDGNTSGGESGSIENQPFFERIATAICDHLTRPTAEGFLYRVDTRLRPQGTQGPLVPSLEAVEIYYTNWGENWERQALLKLRPIAGDPELGEDVQRILTPFTYRKYVDEVEIAETLRSMNDMRRRMVEGLTEEEQEADIKVGPGGIRDVEFIVQAVQILYGGQYPEVRLKGTLESLRRMHESGLLHSKDFTILDSGYRFLRSIEHRLQIDQVRQTYRLPSSTAALNDFSMRLGYPSSEDLKNELRSVRQEVRRLYVGIFGREEWENQTEGLLESDSLSEEHRHLLTEHGFTDPERARRNLISLADNPSTPHLKTKTKRLFKAILPRLMLYLRDCPDADMALNSLEQIINRLGARTTLYGIMAEQPQLIELWVILTGGSRYLSEILLRDPSLAEMIGREGILERSLDREVFQKQYEIIRSASSGRQDSHDPLVRLKNALDLEIGIRYLIGVSDVKTLGIELASSAEFILQEIVQEAANRIQERYPRMAESVPENLLVIAMGKMGGRELNFASDLDLLFLHGMELEEDGTTAAEFYPRLAAKVSTALEENTPHGRLYECDTRLRPYGKSGPLSSSLETFGRYAREKAWVWERMALTRCRPVVGPTALRERFVEIWRESLFSRPFTDSDCREVVDMRFRIEREKGAAALKAGPGGLVDVEFIAQTLVLRHCAQHQGLCASSTVEVLSSAAKAGYLAERVAKDLAESYLFLRDIENRLQIVDHLSIDRLPTEPSELDSLAKRCFPKESQRQFSGHELVEEVEGHTQRIRAMFEEFFAR